MFGAANNPQEDVLHKLGTVALLLGAFVLAADPAMWLVGTWYESGYDGVGWIAFALVAGLVLWSLSTPADRSGVPETTTYMLLLMTAVIRLAAQLLDINVVGALLLAVDVYAVARLMRLHERRNALSPLWLAVLFCFSLPIEPIVQRLVGYDLQQVSALLACGFLQPFFDDLVCSGVRLQLNAVDVLVDLPCSGAELVSTSALLFACINAQRVPDARWGIAGIILCIGLALFGNGIRIALLAVGIAYEELLGFSVMDSLPHTLIGLVMVAVTCACLLIFARCYPANRVRPHSPNGVVAFLFGPRRVPRHRRLWFAASFLPITLLIGVIQPQPVDASPRISPPVVPLVAAGFLREASELTAQEQRYFTRYGGGAERASFGPFGLLLVSTASPLRHLHDPTICLTGMGYDVQLLGTDYLSNSTVYVAHKGAVIDHDDAVERYVVRVSYISDHGVVATSIAEAVWHWLRKTDSQWTMVQRITPDHPAIDPAAADLWEVSMRRAFNLG